MSNFDIKQKKHGIFISLYVPAPNKSWEDKDKQNTASSGQNTSFFCKNWTRKYSTTTPSKSFYIIFVDIFFSNH